MRTSPSRIFGAILDSTGLGFLNFKVCTSLPFRMVTISLRPIFLSVRMGATG